MTDVLTISRAVDVAVDSATAFAAFTDEIGDWYKTLPFAWNDPGRAVAIRFDAGVGGRLVEVWNASTGEGYEMGKILVWEPGSRLVMTFRNVSLPAGTSTEVEVRFEPIESGTRVTLEHRGWEGLPADVYAAWAARAWVLFLKAFGHHVARSRGGMS